MLALVYLIAASPVAETSSTSTSALELSEEIAEEIAEELSEELSEEEWLSSWDSRGELALESRLFSDDVNVSTQDYNAGLAGRLEINHEYGPFQERVRVFGRLDVADDARSTFIVEEAWVQYRKSWFRFRLGADLLNWTATEAFHPADVVNARNLDSDLENFEKLGEPMAQLQLSLPSNTTIELFFMPGYLPPKLPSPKNRQSVIPPGILIGDRVIVDRDGEIVDRDLGPQAAVRLRQVLGPADLSLQFVEHVDRSQPDFVFDRTQNVARPVALTTRHFGLTYQHAIESLLVKAEAAYRFFELPTPEALSAAGLTPLTTGLTDRDHGTVALGLEYGVVHESGPESTLILEAQVLFGPDEPTRKLLSPFQQDVLVGYRLALGDEDSTELLVTAIADVSGDNGVLFNASFARRLGEVWSLRAGVRIIEADAPGTDPSTGRPLFPTGIQALRNADVARITLTRHF